MKPVQPEGVRLCDVEVRTTESSAESRVEESRPAQDHIAEEAPVAMVYNGISHAVMMASPLNLEDFGIGFSLTEGIVDNRNQLLDIEVQGSDLGIEIQMQVAAEAFNRLKVRRRQLSGRTGCGLCGLDALEAIQPSIKVVPRASSIPGYAAIDSALAQMQKAQWLQSQCGATHAAAYFDDEGKLEQLREDVGRHNALDKLIGSLANEPSENAFVVISSRASYEMVTKAAYFGISTLVSVSAPTSMAVDLAKRANMNLVGFVRQGRQVIYNRNLALQSPC